MPKDFDTSWFDLKNYEAFKTMSIEDWIFQFKERCRYYKQINESWQHMLPCEQSTYFLPIIAKLKRGVIKDDPNYLRGRNFILNATPIAEPFYTTSVRSIHSIDLWLMSKKDNLSRVWEACQHAREFVIDDNLDAELFNIACTPHELNVKKYVPFDNATAGYVEINLSATDAHIKNDFDQWLKGYRMMTGYYNKAPKKRSQKKLSKKAEYTQKDFNEWIEYGVIPYLDIVFVAKMENKETPSYMEIGELIFPYIDECYVGRVRDTTRPLAEWLIECEINKALVLQLESQRATK